MQTTKFDPSHIERFKLSGLSMSAYSRAEAISVSTLQYHLSKLRNQESPANFVCVSAVAQRDWFTLQIGAVGLRVNFNFDFRF